MTTFDVKTTIALRPAKKRAFEFFDAGFTAYRIYHSRKIPSASDRTLDRWYRQWKQARLSNSSGVA